MKTTTTTDYSEYNVPISDDPGYYGSNCTNEDGERIAGLIADLVKSEFPGIQTTIHSSLGSSGKITGPDADTCDEIRTWIEDHWTAAL